MIEITPEIKKIFSISLRLPINKITNKLSYVKSDKWDSLNHMSIVAQIEKKYKIHLKMKDIIAMETFEKSIKIVKKNIRKK